MNRARMLGHLNRSGNQDEAAYARRLVEQLPPSAVQAEVFALSAGIAILHDPSEEDVELAERAVAIARQVGADSVEQHARMTLGSLRNDLHHDPDRGIAELTAAVAATRGLGVPDVLLRGINNLASMLQSLGRAEEAVALAREGLEAAGGTGCCATAAPS